jgi:hypothetical protein
VVNVASIAGYGWRQNLERTKGLVGVQGFPDLDALVAEFGIPAVSRGAVGWLSEVYGWVRLPAGFQGLVRPNSSAAVSRKHPLFNLFTDLENHFVQYRSRRG